MSDMPLDNQPVVAQTVKNSWLGQHRLLSALLLHGLWKFKPIHVLVFWVFLAYQGWLGSPYFMYHVVGAPEPGTAQRYVGTLRVQGELQRTKTGWIPPRYFIRTNQGEVEVHCGYRPYLRECSKFYDFHKIYPDMIYSVGYDRYWGMDYIKYPDPIPLRYQANSAASTQSSPNPSHLIRVRFPDLRLSYLAVLRE
jgi:hypothetical protein